LKRFAVDVGGTFTDTIFLDDETGQLRLEKVRSTPKAPEEAVIESIKRTGVDPAGVPLFIHGTTITLNSLLQSKISKIALITTKGFRDVLEIGRCNRPDNQQYNVFWRRPDPLVPRHLRLEISERMAWTGDVLTELDEREAEQFARQLQQEGVDSIAVCLLHSYANPSHEKKIEEIVQKIWPQASVSTSHRVVSEWREFERTSTVVMDAAVKKPLRGYINRLVEELGKVGFKGEVLLMHCAGGTLTARTAVETPISTVISGPVGGVIGAIALGEAMGIKNIVTGDPGGTSFDVSLIVDGKSILNPDMKLVEKATFYPAIVPSVDIRSIGAGGGSIARVDGAGLLHVGPESAGADPGPMVYGKGGEKPTVTDAAVVNGIIDPANFLGGEVKLLPELATKGVKQISERLGMGLHEAADGILTVARDNMASAVHEILIGEGYDPADFTMVFYGGAGGLFAAHIAREMGIKRWVIPVAPAYFSAWGMLRSDIVHTFSQTLVSDLSKLDLDLVESVYKKMEESALQVFTREGMSREQITSVYSIDMRYEGQGHNVEVRLNDLHMSDIKERMKESFADLHQAKYGTTIDASVLAVNLRLRMIGRLAKPKIPEIPVGGQTPTKDALKGRRKVFADGSEIDCSIYDRDRLLQNNNIEGPAIVEEPSHTTLVAKDQTLTVDKFGNLIVEVK
jgi:N-methylhydantoinase A